MNCLFCGSPLPEGAMFCTNCGVTTNNNATEEVITENIAKAEQAAKPIDAYAQQTKSATASTTTASTYTGYTGDSSAYAQSQAYAQAGYGTSTGYNSTASYGTSSYGTSSYGSTTGGYSYSAPAVTARDGSTPALVLGIISLSLSLMVYFFFVSFILSPISIVKAVNSKKYNGGRMRPKAKAGMGLSIAALALGVIYFFIFVVAMRS